MGDSGQCQKDCAMFLERKLGSWIWNPHRFPDGGLNCTIGGSTLLLRRRVYFMHKFTRCLFAFILAFTLISCTLPGATSPTPFSYPTPNLTHTAVFSTPSTPYVEAPSDTPVVVIATETTSGGEPVATAVTTLACVNKKTGRPVRVPPELRASLETLQAV